MKANKAVQQVICLLLAGVMILGLGGCKRKAKDVEPSSPDIQAEELKPYKSNHLVDATKVEPLKDVVNILLIGTDRLEEGEDYARSDVIMIASVDPINDKIKLTSILRDCYVEIPGHGKLKLNRAYTLGGEQLLMETIASNFDIPLRGYVKVDFDNFIEVIDILEGVPIWLTAREAQIVLGQSEPEGRYRLDGAQALKYVTIRKIDNDWYRTSRQRQLLFSVYEEGVRQTEERLFELLYKIYPLVETDLSIADMIVLFYQYTKMDKVTLEEMYVPVDGTFEDTEIYGEFVINFDVEQNQIMLNNFIYKDEIPELHLK